MYSRSMTDKVPKGTAFSGIGALRKGACIVSTVMSSKIAQGYDRLGRNEREPISARHTRGKMIELHDRP